MAALSITAANVVGGAGAKRLPIFFGAAVTAGQALSRDAVTGKCPLADSNGAAGVRNFAGIACCGGADGQPGYVQYDGEINLGATLVPGTTYAVGATPGSIVPVGDLTSGDTVCIIGTARTAAFLVMAPNNTTAVIA